MKKILFIITVFSIFSCSSTPKGDPSIYIEKTISDIVNDRLNIKEAYDKEIKNKGTMIEEEIFLYKIMTYAYLSGGSRTITIRDNEGNKIYSDNLAHIYRLDSNSSFDPNRLYQIKFILKDRTKRGRGWDNVEEVILEPIDGLLTYEEARSNTQAERQRIAQIEADEKLSRVEIGYREAITSRNIDSIMNFLLNNRDLNSLPTDSRRSFVTNGYQEAAKIITRNNNIGLGDFDSSWWTYFHTNNQPNENAFDKNVIYYLSRVRPTQLLRDGTFVVSLGNSPEDSILLYNIPTRITREWRKTYTELYGVLMQYEGLLPVQASNGRTIGVPGFKVLYHYQGE